MEIAYAPDGRTLGAIDSDRVFLWDIATGKELRRLPGHFLGGIAYAPDGKTLATAYGRNILCWESETGRQLREFKCGEEIQGLAYSPDGKSIAWLNRANDLRLVDAVTGKVLHRWPGPANVVPSSFAFSPDSRLLAAACQKELDIPLLDTL